MHAKHPHPTYPCSSSSCSSSLLYCLTGTGPRFCTSRTTSSASSHTSGAKHPQSCMRTERQQAAACVQGATCVQGAAKAVVRQSTAPSEPPKRNSSILNRQTTLKLTPTHEPRLCPHSVCAQSVTAAATPSSWRYSMQSYLRAVIALLLEACPTDCCQQALLRGVVTCLYVTW